MMFKEENLQNIRRKFSQETGVALGSKKVPSGAGKRVLTGVLAACVLLALFLVPISRQDSGILLTVNATDGAAVELGKSPVLLEYELPFREANYGSMAGMDSGSEVLLYSVTAEGEGISKVTYTVAEDAAERVWFQEQFVVSESEFQTIKNAPEGETDVYRGMAEGDSQLWTVSARLGSVYEVAYGEQGNREIYLEYRVGYEEGAWTADAFSIHVEILMEDGTLIEKELRIQPKTFGPDTKGLNSVMISLEDV